MSLPGNGNPWEMTVHLVNPGPSSIDEKEVRRAIGLLVDPNHFVQIQSLPNANYKHVKGSDTEGLVKTIAELAGDKGTYLTLNPFNGPPAKAVKSSEILKRRWFLIDPDANKPAGVTKDASTTDEEKECARQVTESIREHLRENGWPDPIYVDSGNNWQLLYRVELPNDRLSQQLLSKTLKALGDKFNTKRVTIDKGVHDARRICKIPGTMVRKGDGQGDRPHRMARLMSVPMVINPVGIEQIKAVAKLGGAPTKKPDREPGEDDDLGEYGIKPASVVDPWLMTVGASDDKASYALAAFQREVGIVATARELRNETLYVAALKLGTLVGADLLDEYEVKQQLTRAAETCGLGMDGDPKEIHRAITNGMRFGIQNPRTIPDKPPSVKALKKAMAEVAVASLSDEQLVIQGTRVVPRIVNWLWKDRVPRGFISMFAGRTGLGKSFVSCDVVARVTRGDSWPDSSGECVDPGNALIISEDPHDFVLAPRLIELGADMSRVFFMTWEAMGSYTLENTDMLGRAFGLSGNPSLIMIDPPTNFLGEADEHKNAEVRAVIMKLVAWINSIDPAPACIMITHVNKAAKGVDAISRVIGSVAWMTTCRIGHAFAPHPDQPGQVIFVPLKNNLGPIAKGVAFKIAKTETFAKVEWLGEVDTTADEAMGGEATKPRRVTAGKWLIEMFRQKREWTSDDLFAAANQSGVSRNAIFEAKERLDIPKARRVVLANGDVQWTWWVPPNWKYLDQDEGANPTVPQLGQLGQLGQLDDIPF
jgi:hypothetical protein